jgi:peptidoglycan/xylan/chitin deacetylase (PgdA/CDA1 family)
MIGVLINESETDIVSEFFELFKTPWEFYDQNKNYDVLISTRNDFHTADSKLIIYFSAVQSDSDNAENIKVEPLNNEKYLKFENAIIPIYGNLAEIRGKGQPFLQVKDNTIAAGLKIEDAKRSVIRIGYELFEEVEYLLSVGQPPENAIIPTLELHISLLRRLILGAGVSFVEIPPVPADYNFIVCLTHDIDFIKISDHKFDHTMFGFIYRATLGTLIEFIKKKRSLRELYLNWMAVFKLPFIYLGIVDDFWFKFDRYMELENNVDGKSTFFMIPFKNRMGQKVTANIASRRAARYDVMDIPETIKKLVSSGFEVGLHGIDAWHDVAVARVEKARIASVSGKTDIGIRVHWLCFNQNTHTVLDEAGFTYDSTFGYNNAAGYRAGTSQAFKPLSVNTLYELPLNIQDTALFNPKHMALSKKTAWKLCKEIINNTSKYGGILTILWHDRSLSPERLYEDFYIKLLKYLKSHNVWFATGTDACNWFQSRRNTKFEQVKVSGNRIKIQLKSEETKQPPIRLRFYHSVKQKDSSDFLQITNIKYTDIPWRNESEISFDL